MNLGDRSLLESVIFITQNRDKSSLEKALLKTLFEAIECQSILLLNIVQNSTIKELNLAHCMPETCWKEHLTILPREFGENYIRMDKEHENCVQLKFPVSVSTHSSRKIFPIISNGRVLSLLEIYDYKSDPKSYQLILGLVQVFSNFIGVLNDNELDALTGLLNRKTFDFKYSELIHKPNSFIELKTENDRRASDTMSENWLAILDIDHFKRINDTYGHVYGDEVLLLFADLLRQTFRSSDLLFRHGGEEFLVLLAPLSEENAEIVLERFRHKLESVSFPQVGKVTASIGMVKLDKNIQATEILGRADQALYYAKENGRNQVRNYHTLVTEGSLKVEAIDDDIELF